MKQKTYLIDIVTKQVKVKVKAKNKLLWHDQYSNKMLEFEGGKIVPVFNMRLKKIIPKIEDVYYTNYSKKSNKKEIVDWIKNYGSRLGAVINNYESSNKEIAVNVDYNNSSVFEYALDRQGFSYNKQ